MKQKYYIASYVLLLAIIATVFIFQVRAFADKSMAQWYLLIAIGVVGAISYFISKKMKKEQWFIDLQKKKSR